MKATRAELASIFGVSPPTIDAWVRRGCPVAEESRGVGRGNGAKFWVPDVVKWRDENERKKRGDDDDDLAELERRFAAARAENAEFDLAIKRSQLMTLEQYTDAVTAAFARVGARLRSSAPKHAAASIGVTTMQEGLARHEPIIQQLLEELTTADDVPLVPDDPDDGADEESPYRESAA